MKNPGEARRVSLDFKFRSVAFSLVVVLYLATILVPANAASMSVTLESPPDNFVTMNNQPDFKFTATHPSSPTLSCTLWLKLTTSGTPTTYGTNGSVVNSATTTILASSPIPNGQYRWWIKCSDGTASIISEKRTITVNVFRGDRSFSASYDGSTRYYWLDLPDHFDSSVPTPLVIFLHGYSQDRSMYRTYFPVFRQIFHQNGWIVACTECRWIGSYQTWYTAPSRSDITDVINLLGQEFNINRNHIHVMGTSMGGSGTLKYAMFNPDIVASACPIMGVTNFTEFHDWTSDSTLRNSIEAAYGGTPSQVPLIYKDESPLGNEIRFMHTPVFLLHGSADTVVPVSNSRQLNKTLSQAGYDVKYVEVSGVGHYATTLVEGREQEIYEWFRDHPLWQAHLVRMSLTVQVFGNGVTNITGTTLHNQYDSVTVLATPASGSAFDHWTLNGTYVGSLNPYTINMTSNYNLAAVFFVFAQCDVTGPGGVPDGRVDLYDVAYIGKMFCSSDPIADFTGPIGVPDGIVDTYELVTIGRNFGRVL